MIDTVVRYNQLSYSWNYYAYRKLILKYIVLHFSLNAWWKYSSYVKRAVFTKKWKTEWTNETYLKIDMPTNNRKHIPSGRGKTRYSHVSKDVNVWN